MYAHPATSQQRAAVLGVPWTMLLYPPEQDVYRSRRFEGRNPPDAPAGTLGWRPAGRASGAMVGQVTVDGTRAVCAPK